jgi:Ca2+-binding RTX toxin-like protein
MASEQNASTATEVSVPADGEDVLSDSEQTTQAALVSALNWLLGTADDNLLVGTAEQDIFWGGGGADVFQLGAIGVTEPAQADVILDYNPAAGDRLALSEGLTSSDIAFEVIDFNGDGVADATVIRALSDNQVLGVVLNTVDELGSTWLSMADFANSEQVNNAGTDSSAMAHVPTLTIDFLIGTAADDVLVGGDNQNIFVGYDGGDTFVFSSTPRTSLATADIIVDFTGEQGDRLQLPDGISLSEITLQSIDSNSDGILDSTAIKAVESEIIYGLVLNTVDAFGTTILSNSDFVLSSLR